MKREELKKMIRPIVRECVHEAILEGGLLSGIISEVALGLGNRDPKDAGVDISGILALGGKNWKAFMK